MRKLPILMAVMVATLFMAGVTRATIDSSPPVSQGIPTTFSISNLVPAPTVTSFAPSSGAVGDAVTITGTAFTGATEVDFNGTPATSFTVDSDTQISASVPTGATTGAISVTAPGGSGASADPFTVTGGGGGGGGSAPTVTSFAPSSGAVGDAVTITGTAFTGATEVDFNGTPATSFTVDSDTQITTSVPDGATIGLISVTTPGGSGASADPFTVTGGGGGSAPTVTSFDPTSGAVGDPVTITGTAFTAATEVDFHGTPATAFNVDSDTQITASVPDGATTGLISVTTPGGTGLSVAPFTVSGGGGGGGGGSAPSVSSFAPTSGAVGDPVTISGTAFTGATEVDFNGTPATAFSVDSDTQISASVPDAASTGPISVTTPGGSGASADPFTVTGGGGGGGGSAPSVSSFDPTSGAVSDPVTITGTAFTGATEVDFNGTPATAFNVDSDTQITTSVPDGATSGLISVTTPGGTGASADPFTVSGQGYSFLLDTNEVTVAAGDSFAPNASITADPGFTDNVDITIDGSSPDGFSQASPWPALSVPFDSGEAIPIAVDPSVPAGDYTLTVNAHPEVLPVADQQQQILVHVTAGPPALPEGIGMVTESGGVYLDPGTTSVSAGDSLAGSLIWSAVILKGPETGTPTITSPSITATSDSEPSFDSPPASWPFVTTGPDLVVDSDNLVMSELSAPGTVTPQFDATITPGNVPAGGGGSVATIDVTPQSDASQLDVEINTAEGDYNFGDIVDSQFPTLSNGETSFTQDVSGTHLSFVIGDAVGGQTYELQVETIQSNPGAAPLPWAPSVSVSTGSASNDSLVGTSIDVPDPGLGPNGTFTFASADPTAWNADFLHSDGVTFPASAGQSTAPDGSGTMSVDTPQVAAGSTGNTLTFDYTADDGGLSNGTVTVQAPAGWDVPSADDPSANGYVTVSQGDVSVNGSTIVVSGLNMSGGDDLSIVYGDTSGGGNGATAPGAAGDQTWNAQESSTAGTPVDLTNGSPVVTVAAPDGAGTMTASPSTFHVGDTGKTITFTYTADTGGLSSGTVELVVPSDWGAPSVSATDPGYSTSSRGDLSIGEDGQTIIVSGLDLTGGQTFTITYGSKASGGPGSTPSGAGAEDWTTLEQSNDSGNLHDTITEIAASPSISVLAPDGSGRITVSDQNFNTPPQIGVGAGGNTLDFNFAADFGGLADGVVTLAVPNTWTAPQMDDSTVVGYTTLQNAPDGATMSISGRTITVSGLNLAGDDTFDIVYGDTNGGDNAGVTAPAKAENGVWTTREASAPVSSGGTLKPIVNQPHVPVDGPPTITSFVDISQTPNGTTGLPGDNVVITGTGFASTTEVDFTENDTGTPAIDSPADFTIASDTELDVFVPGNAVTGKFSVTNIGGTVTSAKPFGVIVAPSITSISPNHAAIGKPIVINGSGFTGTNEVDFGDIPATKFTVTSDTKLTVTVPVGAATGQITVINPADLATSDATFYVPPTITGLVPQTGVSGDSIEIDGVNLQDVSAVKFGGKAADPGSISLSGDGSSVSATVPDGAKSGKITVTNPGGTVTSAVIFGVIVKPKISSFAPSAAAPGATLTITGTGLFGVDDPANGGVTFTDADTNQTQADASTIAVNSTGTKLTVQVPSMSSGPVTITVANVLDSNTSTKTFSVLDAPEIDSLTTATGDLHGAVGSTLTINGLNLKGASAVWFAGGANGFGQSAKPTSTAATQVTVKVPAGAISGSVMVYNEGVLSDPSADTFTVDYAKPSITTVAPAAAAASASITLTGKYFTGVQDGGSVVVGGTTIDVDSVTFLSDTKITVQLPPDIAVGSAPITVSNSGGTSAAKPFTVAPTPTITGVTPTSQTAGKTVVITGTGLKGTSLVTFTGGKTAKPSKGAADGTSITVAVPKGAQSGSFTITNVGVIVDSDSVVLTVTT